MHHNIEYFSQNVLLHHSKISGFVRSNSTNYRQLLFPEFEVKQLYIGGVPLETRSLPLLSLYGVHLETVNYTEQIQVLLGKASA